MNDAVVGLENLPNVFIHKILVNSTNTGYDFNIVLKMFDYEENSSWYSRIPGLKIKLSMFEDLNIIDTLNEGAASLYDYTDIDNSFTLGYIEFKKRSQLDGYCLYTASVSVNLNYKPRFLNVYAACFLEIDRPFGIKMFDKFYGPMVGEQIIVNGVLNEASNYFYYPDSNEEYAGPVHQKPDGSYMEGSKHSDEPHKEVVLVSETNSKLIRGYLEPLDGPSIESEDIAESAQATVDTTISSNTQGTYQ